MGAPNPKVRNLRRWYALIALLWSLELAIFLATLIRLAVQ